MTKYKSLEKAVEASADGLFKQFGPESAVVVMVGIQDGKDHSAYQYVMHGRCLPLEGLVVRVSAHIQKKLWSGK